MSKSYILLTTCDVLNSCYLIIQVADVRFELAVLPGSNDPAYFNRKAVENFVQYSFTSFNATTPDSSVFDIPKSCQEDKL